MLNGPGIARLLPGDPVHLGRWTLRGRLGSGGMGTVFLGVDAEGRTAAVKRLHPELLVDGAARARFRREVELGQRVTSACVAAVLDADVDGDRPFVAFEYVAGVTLGQHVRAAGPLPATQLRLLALGLAEALRAIHEAGVLHRDLSSGNVLLTDSGPRVVDFGIARAAETAATAVTVTGLTVGTPGWMPPEQVRGEPPSEAGDVFSWACLVAYAAGQAPFGEGRPEAVLYRTVHEPPQLPSLPPPLDTLVPACLDKDPAGRPATRDLVAALLGEAAGEPRTVELAVSSGWTLQPTSPPPVEAPPVDDSGPRRRGGRLRAVAGAAALLVVAVVGMWAAGVFELTAADDAAAATEQASVSAGGAAPSPQEVEVPATEPAGSGDSANDPGAAAPMVAVPEVVGLERAEAEELIRAEGLRVVWMRVRDDDAPPDTVVRVEPADGMVSAGGLVRLFATPEQPGPQADPDDPASYYATSAAAPALAPSCSGVLGLCLGNPIDRALERLGTDEYRYGDGRGGVVRFWDLGAVTLSATSDDVDSITELSVGVREDARATTPADGVVAGQTTLAGLHDAYRSMGAAAYPDVLSGEGFTIVSLWTWLGPEGVEAWSGSVSVGWDDPLADRLFETPADDVQALLEIVGHLPVSRFSVGYVPPGHEMASGAGTVDGSGQAPAWVAQQLADVGDGWDLADGSAWVPDATLNAVTGRFKGAATGRGMHAFFFVRDRGYIGRDTSEPSNIVQIAWRDDTTIALEYTLYRDGDPGCCPTGGSATVRYHWNGERLAPLDPIPPLTGPTHR